MKRFFLAGAAALALTVAGSAAVQAADLPAPPVEMPAIAAAPMAYYDWSGFYAGAHVGYAWGRTDFDKKNKNASHDTDGFLGGGQIGANWQMNSFVLGVEADISATGVEGDRKKGKSKIESELGYVGTARGRLGFAWDRFLVYGTGGFAYANLDEKLTSGKKSWKDDQMMLGWAAGGGVEMAVTDNITMRLEYLYTDLGDETFKLGKAKAKADYSQSAVRAGINYKF